MKSRNELHHEISHAITDKFGRIAVEDLNIKGMAASAVGSDDEPGKMVNQKSGLNRSIL
jgi:putative transposase